jgi:hypothetical protein
VRTWPPKMGGDPTRWGIPTRCPGPARPGHGTRVTSRAQSTPEPARTARQGTAGPGELASSVLAQNKPGQKPQLPARRVMVNGLAKWLGREGEGHRGRRRHRRRGTSAGQPKHAYPRGQTPSLIRRRETSSAGPEVGIHTKDRRPTKAVNETRTGSAPVGVDAAVAVDPLHRLPHLV